MSSLQLKVADARIRYTHSQLLELRRQMLRYARSLPPGSPERNHRRQIARSLRLVADASQFLLVLFGCSKLQIWVKTIQMSNNLAQNGLAFVLDRSVAMQAGVAEARSKGSRPVGWFARRG